MFVCAQSLDATKPHWTLRVVSDESEAGSMEVKKDTERLEEIRAMKMAWETAEPGRAAKVSQHDPPQRYMCSECTLLSLPGFDLS